MSFNIGTGIVPSSLVAEWYEALVCIIELPIHYNMVNFWAYCRTGGSDLFTIGC